MTVNYEMMIFGVLDTVKKSDSENGGITEVK
jgi:hypothetical protein